MTNSTRKIHLAHPYQSTNEAIIIEINENKGIATDSTVAFSEAGGQEGDKGFITILENEIKIPFHDTKKGIGRPLVLSGFPNIQINTPVYHQVDKENLNRFEIGQKVQIEIDIKRRALLTASHSSIHLALMGLETIYPNIYSRIKGCHIKEDSARLDFIVTEKMSTEDFVLANEIANRLIEDDLEMRCYAHPDENEAYYWQLNSTVYPCGGTHLNRTGALGNIIVSKKNLGRNAQRLIVKFPNTVLPIEKYYSHLIKDKDDGKECKNQN